MAAKTSKFYAKSLILPILDCVRQGLIAAEIAKTMCIQPSAVSYYLSRALHSGYIIPVFRDAYKSYELTESGKSFLEQYELNVPFTLRAENIRFRANIVRMPTIPVDWKKIDMHNWKQYSSRIDGMHIRLNVAKTSVLEFLPTPKDGDDPFAIFVILVFECVNVILDLYDKIGLRVGPLELGSRGEWLVYDPVARSFCRSNGQVTYSGIGKVNASKPRCIGELEFFDPRALQNYLLMPPRVANIDVRTERMETMITTLVQKNNDHLSTTERSYLSAMSMISSSCYCSLKPIIFL